MKKLLSVSAICISGLVVACGGDVPSTPTTTVGTGSNSVETELKGALSRTGLGAENIAFQVNEALIFTVGTCGGAVVKTSEGATYGVTLLQGHNQVEILSASLNAGNKGILDAAQLSTVAEKCGAAGASVG